MIGILAIPHPPLISKIVYLNPKYLFGKIN